jgi:hypothetical protein
MVAIDVHTTEDLLPQFERETLSRGDLGLLSALSLLLAAIRVGLAPAPPGS